MTRQAAPRCGQSVLLDIGQAFSLLSSLCREIVCTKGVLWVTFQDDPKDYLLHKGERLSMGTNRNAVLSGIGRSGFSLTQDFGARADARFQGLERTLAT